MKIKRLLLSSSVLLMTTLGLAGCASSTNKSASESSSSKVKTSKVTKSDKAKKESSSTKINAKKNSSKVSDKDVTKIDSNFSQGATSSSKANQSSEIQLGLSDVAVWTDENGITHHVDSDGMDRQTPNGSDQITYNDWSGSLPSNAKVVQAH